MPGMSWFRRYACVVATLILLSGCGGGGGGGGGSSGNNSQTQNPAVPPSGGLVFAAQYVPPALSAPTGVPVLKKTVIGDLNSDGRNDVTTFSNDTINGSDVLVTYQDQNGELDALVTYNSITDLNMSAVRDIAIADINSDGRKDLIILGGSLPQTIGCGAPLVVLYQQANGELGSAVPYGASLTCSGVGQRMAVGDLNSDGRNDIVFSGYPMTAFFQDSSGQLGPRTELSNAYSIGEVRIADMDNDGDNDVVMQSTIGGFDRLLGVVRQTSPGVFSPNAEYYEAQLRYANGFYTFEVGDLNGDGRSDVAVLDPSNSGQLNIFIQNSIGTLNPPSLVTITPNLLYGLEIADLNGDGLNDIAAESVAPTVVGGVGRIYVLHQTAAHDFGAVTTYEFPTASGGASTITEALSIGDITGDNRPDAAVTWSDEGLFVLVNQP